MSAKFGEWVRRWRVGPGMNDAPGVEFYSGFDGEVGDGWLEILERLAEDLVALGWDRGVYQIKEKFGGLRFYLRDEATTEMCERVEQAQEESLRTCEDCGRPGRLRKFGWWRTLCDGCAN